MYEILASINDIQLKQQGSSSVLQFGHVYELDCIECRCLSVQSHCSADRITIASPSFGRFLQIFDNLDGVQNQSKSNMS